MMNKEVREKIKTEIKKIKEEISDRSFQKILEIDYVGSEYSGKYELDRKDLIPKIHFYLGQGYFLEWKIIDNIFYFKVWEYGDKYPTWENAMNQQNPTGPVSQ